MAATPSGKGYWFTTSDGGVFPFGDAKFFGAVPSRPVSRDADNRRHRPQRPTATATGRPAPPGRSLAFGDAADLGGLAEAPNLPIVGMTPLPCRRLAGPERTARGRRPAFRAVRRPTASGGTATNGATPTTPTTGTAPTTTTVTTVPTPLPPASGPSTFSSTAKVVVGHAERSQPELRQLHRRDALPVRPEGVGRRRDRRSRLPRRRVHRPRQGRRQPHPVGCPPRLPRRTRH